MAAHVSARDTIVVDLDPIDKPIARALFALHPLGSDTGDTRELALQAGEKIIVGRTSRSGHDGSMRPNKDNCRFDSPVISRSHATIQFDGIKLTIKDDNSLHGTFVNNRRLLSHEEVVLKSGDILKLGTQVHRNDASYNALSFSFICVLTGVASSEEDIVADSMTADYAYHSDVADLDESLSTDHYEETSSSAPTTPDKPEVVANNIKDSAPGSQAKPICLEDAEDPFTTYHSTHTEPLVDPFSRSTESVPGGRQSSYYNTIFPTTTPISSTKMVEVECSIQEESDVEEDEDNDEDEADDDDEDDVDDDDDDDDDDEPAEPNSWPNVEYDLTNEKPEAYICNAPKTGEDERQQPGSAELAPKDTTLPYSVSWGLPSTNVTDLYKPIPPVHDVVVRPWYDPVRHLQAERVSTHGDYVISSNGLPAVMSEIPASVQEQVVSVNGQIPCHLTFSEEAMIRDSFGESHYDPSDPISEESQEPKTSISIADLIGNETSQHDPSACVSAADQVSPQPKASARSAEADAHDEVLTQDEVSDCITAEISSSRKRKANSMEDEGGIKAPTPANKKLVLASASVLDFAGSYDLASAARRVRRREALRHTASKATHVAAGAMLGMVGTVVFLSSSYAERLIEWLG